MNQEYGDLIDSMVKDGYLKTPEIIEAFKAIDRKNFVTEEHQKDAYINAPLPIGFGQTISQPLTVAFMMELLEPKPGEKILDVGAGSGWAAAILAYIVGKQRLNEAIGEPVLLLAVERVPELKEMAEKMSADTILLKKESRGLFYPTVQEDIKRKRLTIKLSPPPPLTGIFPKIGAAS